MSSLSFAEEVELAYQCGDPSRALSSSEAVRVLSAAAFADHATCERLVALASRRRRESSEDASNHTDADWTFARLVTCARSCKSIRDAGVRPPLLLGVPGATKFFGGLDEFYHGTVTAQHKTQYATMTAAVLGTTLIAPLERAKTLMMVHPRVSSSAVAAGAPAQFNSLAATLRFMRASDASWRVMWRGNTASVIEGVARAAAYSTAYFYMRRRLNEAEAEGGVPLTTRDALVAGAATAALGAVASYPFQVVRSRMHVYDAQRFPSLSQSLVRIGVHEGFGGLFRGFGVSALGVCAYIGLDAVLQRSLLGARIPDAALGGANALPPTAVDTASSSLSSSPTFGSRQRLDLVTGVPLAGSASALALAVAGAIGTLSIQTGALTCFLFDTILCAHDHFLSLFHRVRSFLAPQLSSH